MPEKERKVEGNPEDLAGLEFTPAGAGREESGLEHAALPEKDSDLENAPPDDDSFEERYPELRADFAANLSGPQLAMLEIAESLLALEKSFEDRPEFAGCTLNVGWRYSLSTAEILLECVETGEYLLPDPNASRTEAFSFQFIPKQPGDDAETMAEIDRLGGYDEYSKVYGPRGSMELRVFASQMDGVSIIKLHYNIGTAEGMAGLLHEAFDRVNYPILVSDRYGNSFQNKALEASARSPNNRVAIDSDE